MAGFARFLRREAPEGRARISADGVEDESGEKTFELLRTTPNQASDSLAAVAAGALPRGGMTKEARDDFHWAEEQIAKMKGKVH